MSKIVARAPAFLLFCLFSLSQSTESLFTIGLPQISAEFQIDPGLAQLASSIYFYGFALGIFVLGRLSDYIGRKPVVIFGLSLFIMTCLLSFFAKDIYFLILVRFLQAFGASVGSVIAQAMARDSYSGVELSRLFAGLAAGLAIMPSIGSLIGGNIVEAFGWRYNFVYLFVLISVVCTACIFKLPETNQYIGANPEGRKFFKVFKILLQDKKVLSYAVVIGSFNGILYSFYIEAPFIFISKLGIHPSKYGFLILLLSLAGVSGSMISRRLQARGIEGTTIICRGLQLSMVSCTIFFILSLLWGFNVIGNNLASKIIIIPMLSQGVSYSIIMPLVLRYSLEDYIKVNGTAGSIFGCLYYILVATFCFITTRLHSENIIKLSIFFLFLSLISYYCAKLARKNYNFISPFK